MTLAASTSSNGRPASTPPRAAAGGGLRRRRSLTLMAGTCSNRRPTSTPPRAAARGGSGRWSGDTEGMYLANFDAGTLDDARLGAPTLALVSSEFQFQLMIARLEVNDTCIWELIKLRNGSSLMRGKGRDQEARLTTLGKNSQFSGSPEPGSPKVHSVGPISMVSL